MELFQLFLAAYIKIKDLLQSKQHYSVIQCCPQPCNNNAVQLKANAVKGATFALGAETDRTYEALLEGNPMRPGLRSIADIM